MIEILLLCFGVFCLLLVSEVLWRKQLASVEVSRKLVHLGVGAVMAFSPLFLSYQQIQLMCLAFLVVILLSIKFKLLNSIRAVKRDSFGEVSFAIGIGVCAILQPAPWIFVVAILHLAIADSFAALIGSKWGKKTTYSLFGHKKSILGSLVFFTTSVLIFVAVKYFTSHIEHYDLLAVMIFAPTIFTILENISWYGIDNLTVPLSVVVLLNAL